MRARPSGDQPSPAAQPPPTAPVGQRIVSLRDAILHKYVMLCLIAGAMSILLGLVFIIIYLMLRNYTSSLHYFEGPVPTWVPAVVVSDCCRLAPCILHPFIPSFIHSFIAAVETLPMPLVTAAYALSEHFNCLFILIALSKRKERKAPGSAWLQRLFSVS